MAAATTRRPSGPVLSLAHYRSASPTRVKLAPAGGARSPGASVSVSSSPHRPSRRSCMCSPTNHPGSFRCSLHKEQQKRKPSSPPSPTGSPASSSPLGAKRAMGSALVPIGAVDGGGQWARRALSATARAQSSPAAQHRRRAGGLFRPRPSRLSAVSMAGDRASDNDH